MQYLVKTLLSALLILAISELAKKSSLIGGIVASLPIVSVMAMIFLYIDTKSIEKVADLSLSIFWMVLPSLSLFLLMPLFLKKQIPFYFALLLSCTITSCVYFAALALYTRLGVKI